MFFQRIDPAPELKNIIECFWIVENEAAAPVKQKIIPDGFTEIIFHLKDPYRIRIGSQWQNQSRNLLAGQIRKHFWLENTGATHVVGVKLKPASLTRLFALDMHSLNDRVLDISMVLKDPAALINIVALSENNEEIVASLSKYFKGLPGIDSQPGPVDKAIDMIFVKNGMVTGAELCEEAGVGERQLENLFNKWVGLSPKLYSRIIRFNYIFQLVNEKHKNWTDLTYEAAYYDQSHFIRNFKSFTGESPSAYAFDEKNMANFFLKKFV
jgi:AraC-like DNA-binding protein